MVGMDKKPVIKVRPLTPNEQTALEKTQAVVKPMCDLLRMVPGRDLGACLTLTADDGEMRSRFFELEKLLAALPTLGGTAPTSERKPLFAEHEKMKLGSGYSADDRQRIINLTSNIVESRVLKGEVNPDDPESLKAAVKDAAHLAKSAYNATMEFLAG